MKFSHQEVDPVVVNTTRGVFYVWKNCFGI